MARKKSLNIFLTKIKFIFGILLFLNAFVFARLNYTAVKQEKNYFVELGHEIDFSQKDNYAISTAISVPWFIARSSFKYTYFHNPLVFYHHFSTYHNFTYQGIRFYTDYNFNYYPHFKKVTNRKFTNGFNFFWEYFLLSLELEVNFFKKLMWNSLYSLAFFIKGDTHLGFNLIQKNKSLFIRSFINLNINNFFIRLEYGFSNYIFVFTFNFFHNFFRLKSELTNQPLNSTKLSNHIYFMSNDSAVLKFQ